jgi:hypothetical protein
MAVYGILVVPPGWKEGDPATIDKTTHQHHADSLQTGARLLFYMKEPVDAIVSEGELTGEVSRTEAEREEPDAVPANTASPLLPVEAHSREEMVRSGGQPVDHRTYRLPYRVTRSRATTQAIPFVRLKMHLGSDFSVFDEEWIPLTEAQYNALMHEWERNTP